MSGLLDGSNEVLNIDGVAVQLTNGNTGSTDNHIYSVSVTGTTATITLTTTGASNTDIQTVIDGMSYTNTLVDTPTDGDRIVTITSITDSGASNNTTALTITSTVNVNPVNDDPVVGAPVLPLAYTAGMDIHGTGFTVADIDAGASTDIQVVLSVDEGTIAGSIGNSGLTSLTPNGANNQITILGTATEIDNFLKGFTTGTMTYTSIGTPTVDATFIVTVNDLGNTGSGGGGDIANSVLINTLNNDAPVLDLDVSNNTAAGNNYAATFTEGGSAVNIADSDTSLTDTEGDEVTLQIVAGNIADGVNEILNFGASQIPMDGTNDATLNNVTVGGVVVDVFYDASAQTFSIADNDGNALTLAEATAVLEGITYQNDSGSATIAPARTFTITADDGVVSNSAVSTISLTNTENPPVNTIVAQTVNEDTLTTLTGISVNDTDGDLATVQLTVVSGNLTVSLAGGATISAGSNGSTTLTLSGTQDQINAALATLQYQGNSEFSGTDTLTMVSADADGGTADDTDVVNITVNPVNDPPTVTNAGSTVTFTESDAPVTIDSTLTVGDVDDTNIESATITISGGLVTSEDVLSFTAASGITGSYNSATGVLSLSGSATLAQYEAVLETVTYDNTNDDNPTGGNRTITWVVNDGEDNSTGTTSTVNVVPVNDPPTVTGAESTVTFTESDSPVTIDSTLTVGDVDDTNIESATITISGGLVTSEDVLSFTAASGITGSYNSATGVLSLSGSATLAQYEAVLESVTYDNTNDDNPTGGNRTITWLVNDGDDNSAGTTSTVNVVPVNDAPVVDLNGAVAGADYSATFQQGDAALDIVSTSVTVTDVDDTTLTRINITFAGIQDGANEVLKIGSAAAFPLDTTITTGSPVTTVVNGVNYDISYDSGTSIITIDRTDNTEMTLDEAQRVLAASTYQNTLPAATSGARTFAVTVNDGDDNSAVATSTINVTDPEITALPDSATTDEDTPISVNAASGVLANDTDLNPPPSVITTNLTLNNVASLDSPSGDGTWQDEQTTGFDWEYAAGVTYDASPGSSYAGITGAYSFDGSSIAAFDNGSGGGAESFDDLSGNPSDADATFEIWFRASADSDQDVLFESGAAGDGISLSLDRTSSTNGVLEFKVKDGGADTQISIDLDSFSGGIDPTSEFIQVVGVVDTGSATGIRLYVNGQLAATGSAASITDWAGGDAAGLGGVNSGINFASGGNFEGDIASFRFYESAFVDADVTQNFDAITGSLSVTEINGIATIGSQVTLPSGALVTLNADGSYDYDPNGQFEGLTPTTDSFQYTVSDGTNTTTATVTITVNNVNDAPTLDLDLSAGGNNFATTFTEDVSGAVTIVDTDVTITDVDDTNIESATITLTNVQTDDVFAMTGTLPAGITVDGASTATNIILTGSATLANYQLALQQITFNNTSDNPNTTARVINIVVNDGDVDSNITTTTITVAATNDAPEGADKTLTTLEDTDVVISASDFGFTDVDTGDTLSAVVITTIPTNGVLFNDANNNGVVDGGETITAGSTISVADINNNQLTFKPAADANGIAYDSFTFQVVDNSGAANNTDTTANTITINVTPVAEAPDLDLDANDSSGATGNDFSKTIIPTPTGVPATSIVDTDVTITDVDDTNIESATITLTNAQAGDILAVGALPAGITATIVGDTVGLTGTASLADYQTALQAITFSNTNAIVDGTDRIITFTVNDGDINSSVSTTTLDVFGTPTVNTLVTADTQPTLTGTWDEADATATGLQVIVDGTTYTLGTDAALTTDGSGNWTLNLATAGQTLAVNTFDVSITTTDGVNNVLDVTTNELRVITTPEWEISGDNNVTEGNNASYTISLTGAELLTAGETVSIVLSTADITAIVGTDTGALDAAVTAAIGARTDLTYNAGTNTLTYTAPSNPYTSTYDNTGSNFNDISGTGTVVPLTDDGSSSQTIGFNFDFYGTTYTNVFVGSNGVVTFGGGSAEYGNDDLSASGLMNSAGNGGGAALPGIAAFWTDLNPADGDSNDVFVQQTTEGGVNVLIIQFDDIVPYDQSAGEGGTFQIVLFEGSNDIEVRYQDVIFDGANDAGASATIGVSDGTTLNFTQHSFDSASVADNSHIRYSQPTGTMTDLVIDLSAVVDAPDGPENYSISIGSATGSSALGAATSVTTTIYDIDIAPTLTAIPDAGITFTENVDTNVDLFDSVVIDTGTNNRTVEEITFNVSNLNDGASEVLNIDGTAV
ncbi:MAG: hypothetical protein JKY66_07710, partial [Spongiibacteraceae bacterium]|nr:hypothetical protein [Spongiibacteraceae bacterium]